MQQFANLLADSGLGKGTQRTYINEANKYLETHTDLSLWENDVGIIDYIEANYPSLSSKNQIAKAVISYRKLNGTTASKLLSVYLTDNVNKYNKSLTDRYATEENKLPSVQEYQKYIDSLFVRKEYKSFIINRLIQMFQVRNMDLDLIITRRKEDVDTVKNWLLVETFVKKGKIYSRITYTRNNYKTNKQYGEKTHTHITTRQDPLYIAIEAVLKTNNHSLINDTNIGRAVMKATDGYGEGKIFKILLREGLIKDAVGFGLNRGSNLSTIAGSYLVK